MYNLENARRLINQEYLRYFKTIKNNERTHIWFREKIEHSNDVLKVGVDLVKKEYPDIIQEEFEELQYVFLLHDMARFREAYIKYYLEEECVEHHGEMAYNILKDEIGCDNLPILTAIKHHGSLPHMVYEDEVYISIKDGDAKNRTIKYLKLVRDADKIANMEIFARNTKLIHKINSTYVGNRMGITDKVYDSFCSRELVNYNDVRTYVDYMILFLAWIFDFNYKSSFAYILDSGSFEKLLDETILYADDEEKIDGLQKISREYIYSKLKHNIA